MGAKKGFVLAMFYLLHKKRQPLHRNYLIISVAGVELEPNHIRFLEDFNNFKDWFEN